jgi:hypothetical protein
MYIKNIHVYMYFIYIQEHRARADAVGNCLRKESILVDHSTCEVDNADKKTVLSFEECSKIAEDISEKTFQTISMSNGMSKVTQMMRPN